MIPKSQDSGGWAVWQNLRRRNNGWDWLLSRDTADYVAASPEVSDLSTKRTDSSAENRVSTSESKVLHVPVQTS